MPQIQRILFPSNLSDQHKASFHYVLALAKYFGASVDLLHIYPPTIQVAMPNVLHHQMQQEQARQAKQKATAYLQVAQRMQIPLNLFVLEGYPREQIIDFAEQDQGYDLLVLGSRGSFSLVKAIWGNIISSSINQLNIPILVLPQQTRFKAIEQIAAIVPSIELKAVSLQFFSKLSKELNSTLHFLYREAALNKEAKEALQVQCSGIPLELVQLKNMGTELSNELENRQIDLLLTIIPRGNKIQHLFAFIQQAKHLLNTPIPLLLLKE